MFDKLVAPAIVALLFGGVAAYVLELYRGRREGATKIADGLREDLQTAQTLVSDYWSRSRRKGDEVLEAKLVGLQAEIASTLALLESELKEKIPRQTVARLFDALTGGDFQSKTRKADLDRLALCAKFTAELRASITRARFRSMSRILGT